YARFVVVSGFGGVGDDGARRRGGVIVAIKQPRARARWGKREREAECDDQSVQFAKQHRRCEVRGGLRFSAARRQFPFWRGHNAGRNLLWPRRTVCGQRFDYLRRAYLILTVNLNVPDACGATEAIVSVKVVEPAEFPAITPPGSTAELST